MQPAMQHQMMGYDRTSAMFSPDGRLLQVEYAKKTVRQGTSAIGLVCKDGVILVADRRILDKLIVAKSVEKVFQIDEHIGASASGLLMDGRVLIERAQVIAQQHRVSYDQQIDVHSLVRDISDMKQWFTQVGGARPFGVSILFAGIDLDDGPKLYVTDPTGSYWEYKALAVGENETEIKSILEKEYKETMNIDEGISLTIRALKKVLGKEFDLSRVDGCYIKTDQKKFTKIEKDHLKRLNK